MSVNKVIEVMSESDRSWEDAAQKAVDKVSKTVKGIKSIWIQDFAAKIDDKGKLKTYRITGKVAFEVD